MHILHTFDQDFYDQELRVIVAGYIRPEQNYESLGKIDLLMIVDALIQDIQIDKSVANHSLNRPAYQKLSQLLE